MTATALRTAAEYRTEAQAHRAEQARSIANSDSDGFLSQWASGRLAAQAAFAAQVAEADGMIQNVALFLNGALASTNQKSGQYGLYWVLDDAATAAFGKRFFNPSGARDGLARDAAKGFTYGTVRIPAVEVRGQVTEDATAVREGRYEIVATDGAYADHANAR